jgi:hypothetical protein
MKEKYFLCVVKWDAKQRREVLQSKSKGYDTLDELLKAAAPWIASHLGTKFFIQRYHA